MKRRFAFTVAEIGIGLIVITFLIIVSIPIITHNNQQKEQTQAEYLASLNSGAEKSDVAKLKQQTMENEQRINSLSTRLAGVEEYVKQYVANRSNAGSNNVISNNRPPVRDGSYVCNVTGFTDDKNTTITPSDAEMPELSKEVSNGTKKVIFTCGIVKQ